MHSRFTTVFIWCIFLGWHIAAIDNVFLAIYVMEAALKIIVYKKIYFADGWNVLGRVLNFIYDNKTTFEAALHS